MLTLRHGRKKVLPRCADAAKKKGAMQHASALDFACRVLAVAVTWTKAATNSGKSPQVAGLEVQFSSDPPARRRRDSSRALRSLRIPSPP